MPGARQDIAATDLINPILNSPYDAPESHFEIGPNGPTGIVLTGRRPSESFIPVPASRKGRHGDQQVLDFDITGERREQNSLINDIRREVERWRANGWNGVTPYTRTLLSHWAARPPTRDDPVLFCQREAAETAIFLAEVAGRHGTADYRRRIEPQNLLHSDGLPRVGMKMATGTGKTVVMAMIIAWQTINAVRRPNSSRFTRGFLIVAPGITIRDRLRVLQPNDPDSYYRSRELVPSDMLLDVDRAKIVITNFHAFKLRETLEISKGGRLLLQGRTGPELKTLETEGQMIQRVMPELMGLKNLMAINDEAHHCYREKPPSEDEEELKGDEKQEAERNREAARLWISGLEAVNRKIGLHAVLDLSATPFFLRGSGLRRGDALPLDDERLLAHGRHRVRHRQTSSGTGGRQHPRIGDAGLPQPLGAHPHQDAEEGEEQATKRDLSIAVKSRPFKLAAPSTRTRTIKAVIGG
jgi:type III restriction enzyme